MAVTAEEVRAARIEKSREFFLEAKNFIHYLREFKFAPDAQWQPHGQGAERILAWRKIMQLVMWPRGTFKSHCFDAGLVGREIDMDPNIRVLIASETYKQAEKHGGLVKSIFESAPHIEIFGVHAQKVNWTKGEFTSAQRTNFGLKEPTVTCTGTDQVRTGMHYDLVVMDDIVSPKTVLTPEGIEQTNDWFGETLAQLDPGCRLLIIGTRHHFFDQYGRILKDPDLRELFDIWITKAREPDDDTGVLFFPERQDHKFLNRQKLIMPKLYPAFYLNSPRSDEEQMFKQDQFQVINEYEIPKNIFTTILTDFASGENRKNDRTCLFVVGLNVHRDVFVLDCEVGRWLPDKAVCNALLMYQKWQHRFMKGLTIEKTCNLEWAKAAFRKWSEKLSVRPNIIEIAGRSLETKWQRIQGMQPRFVEGGRIFWSSKLTEDTRLWELIRMEITEFPFSQHDDIPDCLSDVDCEMKKGGFYVPSPPPGFNPARVPGMQKFLPTLVGGRYNAKKVTELDLDELLKGKASEIRGDDIWTDRGRTRHSSGSARERGTWPFN